ncbi:Integrase catalytic core [Trinorchestia longiramus]|nr:Integrase catalytic core [Trinorchestia longiramus]
MGVGVMQAKNEVFLEQSAYIKALLSRFGMDKANAVATPVYVTVDLVTTSDEVEECDKDLYQSAVGSLCTKEIDLMYCPSNDMLADIFTKESISDAQKEDPELTSLLQATKNSLRLVLANGVYCDADRPNRPYIPVTLRRGAIAHYHSLSHPGTDRTLRLIAERYVWPSMRKDVKHFVQHCHDYQSSKVIKHNRAALQACAFTGNKFDSVQLDLVGPLPTSRGYSYLLTMIDRFTLWVEAVPISDITAETVARTFFHSWIARFGAPLRITHDRGAQFASKLWADVSSLLGCANFSTTAFHPQSNGLIERVHRDLKNTLKCLNSRTDWVDHLPMVLLS